MSYPPTRWPARRFAGLAALAVLAAACDDAFTSDRPAALDGQVLLSDSVATRGATVRAHVSVPDGFELEAGSVRWTLDATKVTSSAIGGASDSVDLRFTGTGPAELRATYTVKRRATEGGSGVSSPAVMGVKLASAVAVRTVTIAPPSIVFATAPSSSVAAGAPLGAVRVELRDAHGHALGRATDSVMVTAENAAGAAVALAGSTRAKATAGVASYDDLAVTRAGAGYKLVATSPTISGRAEATFAVVAGAPDASQSTMTVGRATLPAGDTTTVTIVVKDQYGNAVASAAASAFAAAATRGAVGTFTCAAGTCTAIYTAPAQVGAASVSATIGSTAVGGSPAAMTVVAGPASQLVLVTPAAGAASRLAFGTQPVLELRDAYGNVVSTSGTAVTVSASTGGTIVGTATASSATGVATFGSAGLQGLVGSYTLTYTAGALTATQPITLGAGAATRLAIAGSATQAAGSAQTISVTAYDADGNVATGYAGTKSLTFSGAAVAPSGAPATVATTAFGSATTLTFANGVATGAMTLVATGTPTIATTDGTLAAAGADRLAVTVSAGAPSAARSTLSTSAATVAAGGTLTATVVVRDAFGNVVTNATSASFTGGASSGTLGSFTCSNGTCSATWTAPQAAGASAITATIGGAALGGSPAALTVTPAAPSQLAITTSAAGASSGAAFTTQPVVEIRDAFGNRTASSDVVTMTVSAGGTVVGTATVNASAGIATFTTVGISGLAGGYTLTFSSGSLTSATQPVTLVAGVAAKLRITGSATQVAGAAQTITITAYDAAGNVATSYAGAKSLTFSGASTSAAGNAPSVATIAFGSATAVSFTNGAATASMILRKVESATVATTDGSLAASGADRLAVAVTAAAPNAAQSALTVGSSALSAGQTTTVTVTVKDADGNVVTNATPSAFTGSATLGTLGSFSCSNGTCTATYTATTAGAAQVGATIGGQAVSGSPATITVTAGAATQLALVTPAAGAASGAAFATQPVVELRDANGNLATAATGAVTVSASAGGTIVGTATVSPVNGVVQFANVGLSGLAGSYTLTYASGSLTSASQSITLAAGSASRLRITGSATQVAGAGQSITITAYDAAGNVASGYAGAKSLTFSGASSSAAGNAPTVAGTAFGSATSVTFAGGAATATMILRKVESAVVAATDGSVSASGTDRLTVAVSAGAASAAQSGLSVGSTTLAAGQSTTVTVVVKDAEGNVVTGGTPSALAGSATLGTLGSFSCTNGTCTATYTATTTGSAQVGTSIGGQPVGGSPASITVTAGAATQLVLVTPAAGASSGAAFTTQPVVELRDANGNVATGSTAAVTVSASTGGTIVGTGTVTAAGGVASFGNAGLSGLAGSYTLTYSSGSLTSASQSITLVAGTASRLRITGSATQVAGAAQTITITAYDAAGNVATTYAGTKALTFSGASTSAAGNAPTVGGTAFGSATSVSFTNGAATASMVLRKVESATVAATDGSVVASGTDRLAVAVSAAAPDAAQSTIAVGSTSLAAGQTTTVTVTVKDADGNVVAGATPSALAGSATLGTLGSFSCSNGTCSATYTATTAGSAQVGTTIGGQAVSGSPATITVTAGAATQLVLVTPAAGAASGDAFTTQPVLELRDANGNIATGATAAVTISASTGGTIVGTATVSPVNGVVQFGNAGLSGLAGTYTLNYTATALTGASQSIALGAGQPAHFAVTGSATQSAGGAQSVTITAYDAAGNVVTGYTGAKSLTFSGASSSPAGNPPTAGGTDFGSATAVTFTNGVATVAMVLKAAEAATIAVTDGTIAATGTDRLAVAVAAGTPDAASSSVTFGATTLAAGDTTSVTVTVKDAEGNVVTTVSPTSVTGTSSSGTLGSFTCTNGSCSATYTATTSGTATIGTEVGGTPVTSGPSTIAVTPAAASQLAITTSAAGAASGAAFTTQPVVEIRDAGGNLVTSSTTPVTMTVSSGGTIVGTYTVTPVNGVATFTDAGLSGLAGNYTLSFEAGSLTSATQPIALTPGAATTFVVTGSSTQTAGTSQTVTVTAYDAAGNVATGYTGSQPVTFGGASVAPSGATPTADNTALGGATAITFTNGVATASLDLVKAETAAITATSGSVSTGSGGSLAVTVSPSTGAASQTTTTVADANLATGDTTTVSVVVRDQYGNVVTDVAPADVAVSPSSGTLGPVSCTNGTCTATYTATAPGTITIETTVGGTTSTSTATVTVTPSFSQLALTTSAAGANSGAAFTTQPVIELRDGNGNLVTSSGVPVTLTVSSGGTVVGTYTVTTVNGVATFTDAGLSGTVGSYTLTYTAAGGTTTSQSVALDVGAPAATTTDLSLGSSSVTAGGTTTVTITVRDDAGNVVTTATPSDITASASIGTLGAFSCTNGVCTATYTATQAGSATISASVGGSAVASSPSTITVNAGPATQLVVATPAAGAASRAAFTTQPVIEIRDANGYLTTSTASVTMTVSAGATVLGTSTVNAVGGVVTFANVGLQGTAGSYTLTFASTGLPDATQSIALGAGTATRLQVTGDSTQLAGVATPMTVTAYDADGNVATSYTGTKSMTFSGASQGIDGSTPTINDTAVGSATSVSFTSGVATISTRFYRAEVANVGGNDGTVFAAGGDRLLVRVIAGSATAAYSSVSLASTTVVTNGTTTVTVTVRDAYGNVVPAATAADVAANASTGTLGAFSCTNGVCTATYTAPGSATTATVTVTVGGAAVLGSPATITVANNTPYLVGSTQGTIAVNEVSERMIFYVTQAGTRAAVTQPTTFALSSTGSGAAFYSDRNGTAAITTASVPAGVDSLVFYYKQTAGGGSSATISVTRTAGDVVTTGTATLTVVATASASTRLSGQICSATSSNSVTNSLTSTGTCTAQAGQLLFMVYGHDADNASNLPNIPDPAGWTLLRTTTAGTAASANQLRTKVYYKMATTNGSVTPTFTAPAGTKVRMTYSIVAMTSPNATTPIGNELSVSGATVPGGNINLPAVTATLDASAVLAYTVQNIGSNAYVAPAGLATIAQAGQGGQAITLIIFSKDRVFSGQTPVYTVKTSQTGNAYVGGQIIVNPQ